MSKDRSYRYVLWRNWRASGKRVLFIGLNPSTADHLCDDPTIRRCIGFARAWGYDGMLVGNLFAFRSRRPDVLRKATSPIGPDNHKWLLEMASAADLHIACWGNAGRFMSQDQAVHKLFDSLHCLKLNSTGTPAHPLYLRKSLTPVPFLKNPVS